MTGWGVVSSRYISWKQCQLDWPSHNFVFSGGLTGKDWGRPGGLGGGSAGRPDRGAAMCCLWWGRPGLPGVSRSAEATATVTHRWWSGPFPKARACGRGEQVREARN